MTDAERRRVIDDICDAALERDESERAAFVADACGADEALRREVEALLSHARAADAFLAAPLGAVAADALTDDGGPSLVGRQFGAHKIVALLGAGGMGQVYRARDTTLGRDVAIKVAADLIRADRTRLARFEREARVLATLNHPHIGAIYGVEESEGVRGLVLELVEGGTLAERVAHGPLPIREALEIARQVADAVEAAHERGVIHRDLKPANIKITPDGVVKVLDFGLAKVFARDDAGLGLAHTPTVTLDGTQEGVIAGTAAYMSPEQARGLPIDKRTDIWAFGCVLYEMLTGRVPFRGPTVSDTIARILEREPDWTILPATTPPGIHRLLQRCFEKDPKRRLRDIGDARLDVDEALRRPESSSATDERAVARPVTGPASRRRRLGWAIAAAATLFAIGYAFVWQLERSEFFWRNPLDEAKSTRLINYRGAAHHAAMSRDGKVVSFLWNGNGVWDAWSVQVETGHVINLTNGKIAELRNPATRTFAFNPDGSLITLWHRSRDPVKGGQVNAYWAVTPAGGDLRQYLKEMPVQVSEIDWSPDGQRIVFHPPTDGDPLFVANADGTGARQIHIARKGVHCHFPTWSPDGDFIYFVQGFPDDAGDIWRVRSDGLGDPVQITVHNSRVSFPTFIDKRTLLYLATDQDGGGPWIYSVDVERRRSRKISMGVEYTSLAGSADGRRLVATEYRSSSSLWRVPITSRIIDESGASAVSLPDASAQSPRFGPDFHVYRAPRAGTNVLWKLSGGTSTPLYEGLNGRVIGGPALAPDGRLAFVVQNARASELYVMNADRRMRRVARDLDVRGAPDWAPTGEWSAIAADVNGEPRVHKIHVESGRTELLVKDEYSIDPKWSPSGRYLVYSGADSGTTFPVKAVNADGTPHTLLHELMFTRGERRLVFAGRDDALIVLRGDISHKDFYFIDLQTGEHRQLTKLGRDFGSRDFDVSADGREIIFDRTREESGIVLIDLRRR